MAFFVKKVFRRGEKAIKNSTTQKTDFFSALEWLLPQLDFSENLWSSRLDAKNVLLFQLRIPLVRREGRKWGQGY